MAKPRQDCSRLYSLSSVPAGSSKQLSSVRYHLLILTSRKCSSIWCEVTAYSSLLMLGGVLLSQVYWYLMVYVLNKLPNVPESDPLYSVSWNFVTQYPYPYSFTFKVSQYLRNTLVGTSVFLGFQSMHSQYLQFNFMLSISKCSCSVFQNVHAVYLGFENTVSFSVCALSWKNIWW